MRLLKQLFTPHQGNDYTPDLLQRAALGIMLLLVLISFTMSNLYALLWQSSSWLVGAVLPAVVVEETNEERDTSDLPPLIRNPILDAAARMKAEDMATRGYFAHYSPDGISPWHWFSEAGYGFVHAGENLAVHFTDSKAVVDAWMDSPTHRANIVNGNYREIGVGTARGRFEGYDTVFVVQLFGTPALSTPTQTDLSPIVVLPEVPSQPVAVADTAVDTDLATDRSEVAGAEILLEDVSTLEVTESIPTETATALVGDTVVVYTDTVATSTNLPEAPLAITQPDTMAVSGLASLATSPSTLLQRIYLGLGFLAIIALVLSVVVEWRVQRPRQIIYGVGLLLLMSILFYIHTYVTGGSLIV